MPAIRPGDDVSGPPKSPYEDAVSSLDAQLSQFGAQLQLVFDDPGEFVAVLTDEVLDNDPEQRFVDAASTLQDHIEAEFGSVEAFYAQLPDADREFLLTLLEESVDSLIQRTVKNVQFYRDAEPFVLLGAAYQIVLSDIRLLRESNEEYDDDQLASCMIAILSRLYSFDDLEHDEFRTELVGDVVRGLYYTSTASGQDPPAHPSSLDDDELLGEARRLGAAVAYARFSISVGRGAELAGVSRPEFERVLDRFDVEPRYGPESVEELHDDTGE